MVLGGQGGASAANGQEQTPVQRNMMESSTQASGQTGMTILS